MNVKIIFYLLDVIRSWCISCFQHCLSLSFALTTYGFRDEIVNLSLSYYYKIALENKGTFISCSIQFDQHYYISYDRISMLFPVIDVVENNQARFLDTFKDIEILNIITRY